MAFKETRDEKLVRLSKLKRGIIFRKFVLAYLTEAGDETTCTFLKRAINVSSSSVRRWHRT